MPVCRITPVAVPLSTLLPMKQMFCRSNGSWLSSAGTISVLSTGIASPVSADWLTCRVLAASRRISAGTRSPAAICTISPGTSWSTGISSSRAGPAMGRRCTLARVLTIARSLAAAWLERCSCRKASVTLSTTMTQMTTAARASPVTQDTAASDSSRAFSGFFARPASSCAMVCRFSRATWLGPMRARRTAASASVRPSTDVPTWRSSSSAGRRAYVSSASRAGAAEPCVACPGRPGPGMPRPRRRRKRHSHP